MLVAWTYDKGMIGKQRLSATVDADLLAAAERAAESGEAKTISAWVNDALRLKLEHDLRLQALAAFLRDEEAAHGEITDAEIERTRRKIAKRAIVVRGRATKQRRG